MDCVSLRFLKKASLVELVESQTYYKTIDNANLGDILTLIQINSAIDYRMWMHDNYITIA